MGVPSFFKWLAKRYPRTVQGAADKPTPHTEGEQSGPASASAAASAAGGMEKADDVPPPLGDNPIIDNLYLDMNGIIHPVSLPLFICFTASSGRGSHSVLS
jgi:5'-3' exoribonuclease 2